MDLEYEENINKAFHELLLGEILCKFTVCQIYANLLHCTVIEGAMSILCTSLSTNHLDEVLVNLIEELAYVVLASHIAVMDQEESHI